MVMSSIIRWLSKTFGSFAVLAVLAVIAWNLGGFEPVAMTGAARVIDGDTLEIEGQRIRLLGIDAPERSQLCRRAGADWPCGIAASSALSTLIAKGGVTCDMDGRDKYGRALGQCRANDVDLNARMVESGLALGTGGYFREEWSARQARKGMWSGSFERPSDWRAKNGA